MSETFAQKMTAVHKAVASIPKTGWNKSQGYMFSTVEDIKAGVNAALVANGLYIGDMSSEILTNFPSSKTIVEGKEVKTRGHSVVKVSVTITDGTTSATYEGLGEAYDEKSVFAAFAGALKYAFQSGLVICTGEKDDPEEDGGVAPVKAPNEEKPGTPIITMSPADTIAAIAAVLSPEDLSALKASVKALETSTSKEEYAKIKSAYVARSQALSAKEAK